MTNSSGKHRPVTAEAYSPTLLAFGPRLVWLEFSINQERAEGDFPPWGFLHLFYILLNETKRCKNVKVESLRNVKCTYRSKGTMLYRKWMFTTLLHNSIETDCMTEKVLAFLYKVNPSLVLFCCKRFLPHGLSLCSSFVYSEGCFEG